MSVVAAWAVLVFVVAYWHREVWEPVKRIECLHCHNRRMLVRWATIGIVGMLLVWHAFSGTAHTPDFAFYGLVIVSEFT